MIDSHREPGAVGRRFPDRLLSRDEEGNMAPDERARIELSQRLAEQFGPEVGGYLMEVVPPFSWHEIATKSDLRALEERLDESFALRLDARLHQAENRILRWTVGSVFGGIAAIGGAAAGIAALVS
jgi:hypothetical protein